MSYAANLVLVRRFAKNVQDKVGLKEKLTILIHNLNMNVQKTSQASKLEWTENI